METDVMTQVTNSPPALAPNASMLTRIRVALNALRILKDDPANPDYARTLHISLDDSTYARLGRQLRESPDFRRLLDERPTVPGDVDLETLARLPAGTLGHEFAHYFRANGIQPFTYEYPVETDGDYLYKHYRETHDIHHLITRYGIDPTGELELQAFYFGNLGLRHAALIALLSFPYVLTQRGLDFRALRDHFRRLRAAYRRGKRSRNLLSVDYGELWTTPVSELSERFCQPARS
jgi:ubiquinone biosynthesis protein COQ4